jgi:hypothetical protein
MRDVARARDDLSAFADLAGRPLAPWQADSLRLESRVTAIVAPRQSGKSRSLGVLAAHWAFKRPNQRVLIVSAGEDASRRLLADVRSLVTGSRLLRASIVDEQAQLIVLSNGSEIRSVPASERQIRGWSVDLLLVDEAALVSDDLLLGAAFPTTAARPDARIVLASSATVASGAFFDHVILGRQGAAHVRAFAWRLVDASWISPSVIAAARASMSPARFAAEYEGEFASGADAMFSRALLDRATAEIVVPGFDGLAANAGLLGGVDWGATTDRSAVVALGRLLEPAGLLAVMCAHAWPSGHPLDGQPGSVIASLVDRAGAFELLTAESNGLGLPLAQELERRVTRRWPRSRVKPVHTDGAVKAATYSAIRLALEQGRLVVPASAVELRRELLLLRVTLLASGGERIEASREHDDLPDALMLACGPYRDGGGAWRSRLGDMLEREPPPVVTEQQRERADWVSTGGGARLPAEPRLLAAQVGPGPAESAPSPFGDPRRFREWQREREEERARAGRPKVHQFYGHTTTKKEGT